MSDGKRYGFGTVIRVDSLIHPKAPHPDTRRWMVISFDDRHKWTTIFLGPDATIAHWSTLHGFIRDGFVRDET